jgi:hypothetical protein
MRWAIVAALFACCGVAWADGLPKNISEIKTLTVERAEALSQREGALWLTGLASLNADTAKALANSMAISCALRE